MAEKSVRTSHGGDLRLLNSYSFSRSTLVIETGKLNKPNITVIAYVCGNIYYIPEVKFFAPFFQIKQCHFYFLRSMVQKLVDAINSYEVNYA